MARAFGESRDLVFSPSRSDLVVQSSRFAGFVRNREIEVLSMVSGPVLLKIKGKSWIFIFLVAKTCPGRFSTRFHTFATFSGCKNVPGSAARPAWVYMIKKLVGSEI